MILICYSDELTSCVQLVWYLCVCACVCVCVCVCTCVCVCVVVIQEQYRYCYEVAQHHSKSSDIYANT